MKYYDELMELEADVYELQVQSTNDEDEFDIDKFNNAVVDLRKNAEKFYCVSSYKDLEEKI